MLGTVAVPRVAAHQPSLLVPSLLPGQELLCRQSWLLLVSPGRTTGG